MTADPSAHTAAMTAGRRSDTVRRRQRVHTALADAVNDGDDISVTTIARRAGVNRSFLYRHADLLEQLHAAQAQPSSPAGAGPGVSRASLQADLLNAHQRAGRLAARVHQLEARLSDLLGEHAWHESGLGAPADIDQLNHQITTLDQHVAELRLQLEERDQELGAARAANRELMTRLNTPQTAT